MHCFLRITIAMFIEPATLDIPKMPAERRAWVIYQLRIRGLSLSRLARDEGVSHQAMSLAFTTSSSHLQETIAKAIGLTARQLFPEYFDASGNRLTWTRERQRSTRPARDNVQSEEAA